MKTVSQQVVQPERNAVGLAPSLPTSLPAYPSELQLLQALVVRVVTPEGILWQGPAKSVILPSPEGEIGILRGHVALTTSLDIGVLRIRTQGRSLAICLFGGWAQVEGDEVVILVKDAQKGEDIDPQMAQSTLEEAAAALTKAQNRWEKLKAREAFKQAQARWKAAQESNIS